MINFHKTLKTSKDIQDLAEEIFITKETIKKIKENSEATNMKLLSKKLTKIKSINRHNQTIKIKS
jgi:hypothetical protein